MKITFPIITSIISIAIGTVGLSSSMNFTSAFKTTIIDALNRLGDNTYYIKTNYSSQNRLLLKEAYKLKKSLPKNTIVTPIKQNFTSIDKKGVNVGVVITQTNEKIKNILEIKLKKGRFFSSYEQYNNISVCVITKDIEINFFDNNAFGKKISLLEKKYLIIGVIDNGKKTPYIDYIQRIFIPYKSDNYEDSIDSILLKTNSNIEPRLFEKKINNSILNYKNNPRYKIWSSDIYKEKKMIFIQSIEWAVNSIFIIVLLIVCMSTTNTLLMAVNERKKEIGIRMAVGANQKDIIILFFKEGVVIVSIGGGIGLVLSFVLTNIIFYQLKGNLPLFDSLNITYSFVITLKVVFTIAILSIITSLIPAIKASKVDPSLSLRE